MRAICRIANDLAVALQHYLLRFGIVNIQQRIQLEVTRFLIVLTKHVLRILTIGTKICSRVPRIDKALWRTLPRGIGGLKLSFLRSCNLLEVVNALGGRKYLARPKRVKVCRLSLRHIITPPPV